MVLDVGDGAAGMCFGGAKGDGAFKISFAGVNGCVVTGMNFGGANNDVVVRMGTSQIPVGCQFTLPRFILGHTALIFGDKNANAVTFLAVTGILEGTESILVVVVRLEDSTTTEVCSISTIMFCFTSLSLIFSINII